MKPGKLVSLFLICVILSLPLVLLFHAPVQTGAGEARTPNKGLAAVVDRWIVSSLPYTHELRQGVLRLRMAGGQVEFDNIYYTGDSLMKDFRPTTNGALQTENTQQIQQFVSTNKVPTYLAILPTACVVNQKKLPQFTADMLYNQPGYIKEVYRSLAGNVSTIDVYPALFGASADCLYYRTEDNLNAYGGYVVYRAMAQRLGLDPKGREQFEMEDVAHDFRGDLAARWQYEYTGKDILTLYHYVGSPRRYLVTHPDGEPRIYNTLYPTQMLSLSHPTNVYLGGLDRLTIDAEGGGPQLELLVFGDKTALSYLPFLAAHYRRIQFVDLAQMTPQDIYALDINRFDQVLFAYSIETYMNTDIPALCRYTNAAEL